ncbi:MAG: DUF4390 domain-containing protein [Ottowia sp.]|nr:DUF4390 domain-containing protein [Ottowia sp.]
MQWFKSSRRDFWPRAAALVLGLGGLDRAAAQASSLDQLQVQRTDDGLLLYAEMRLQLARPVQTALRSGIPVYFVARATVLRERWYWADEQLAAAARYTRISYHPLTRRWRLNVSSQPISSTALGTGLSSRYFDTLDEILAATGHIAGWQVADAADLLEDGRQILEFDFRLDTSRLPAALRVGATREAGWRLSFTQRIDLGQQDRP